MVLASVFLRVVKIDGNLMACQCVFFREVYVHAYNSSGARVIKSEEVFDAVTFRDSPILELSMKSCREAAIWQNTLHCLCGTIDQPPELVLSEYKSVREFFAKFGFQLSFSKTPTFISIQHYQWTVHNKNYLREVG